MIQKIAIYGAGAIGGWMGVRLAASGCDVSVVARGDTLAAVRAHGLRLREGEAERPFPHAVRAVEQVGVRDAPGGEGAAQRGRGAGLGEDVEEGHGTGRGRGSQDSEPIGGGRCGRFSPFSQGMGCVVQGEGRTLDVLVGEVAQLVRAVES